jgi:predicted nicotinamide N-methyase
MRKVESTIWDAEVLATHLLHLLYTTSTNNNSGNSCPTIDVDSVHGLITRGSLLELGAGTALSTLLAAIYTGTNTSRKLCVQELNEDILQHSFKGFASYNIPTQIYSDSSNTTSAVDDVNCSSNSPTVQGVAGCWGRELVHSIRRCCRLGKFDLFVLCDLFYHCEHFQSLLQTCQQLSAPSSVLLVVYEVRRKDLTDMIANYKRCFSLHWETDIDISSGTGDIHDGGSVRLTKFKVHVFSGCREGIKISS